MSVTEPPTTAAAAAAPAAPEVAVAPAAPGGPVTPAPAASSKAWLGWLAGFVVLALLVGATAVLFVRVQDAQHQADDAVSIAGGNQAQLQSRLDQIDQALARVEQRGQATSDDVETLTTQLTALKKCVNTALDSIAQAGQTGKPVAVTKC